MDLPLVTQRLTHQAQSVATLTLPFHQRQKSRLRARLDSGEDVGLMLPRGTRLRGGDLLRAEDGRVIRVQAAAESVSTVRAVDPTLLARACYHLGNRHVPVQIGETWLRYLQDHVLDRLVRSMGLIVTAEQAPFEPEAGAYQVHGGRTQGVPHGHG